MLASGIYKLFKLLDYEKNNGSQDRDDTALVAQVFPHARHNDGGIESKYRSGDVIFAELRVGSPPKKVEAARNDV